MKKLILAALVTMIGSASFAGGSIVCTNAGFTNLTVKLTGVSTQSIALTVTAAGDASAAMPKVGETAVLTLDGRVSGNYAVLRSDASKGRVFEFSADKLAIAADSYKASLRVASADYGSVLSNYEMTCERK